MIAFKKYMPLQKYGSYLQLHVLMRLYIFTELGSLKKQNSQLCVFQEDKVFKKKTKTKQKSFREKGAISTPLPTKQ